jgi:hypothetical protein
VSETFAFTIGGYFLLYPRGDRGEPLTSIIEKYELQKVYEAILKAMAEGKPNEDPDIILKARSVRAVANARKNPNKSNP